MKLKITSRFSREQRNGRERRNLFWFNGPSLKVRVVYIEGRVILKARFPFIGSRWILSEGSCPGFDLIDLVSSPARFGRAIQIRTRVRVLWLLSLMSRIFAVFFTSYFYTRPCKLTTIPKRTSIVFYARAYFFHLSFKLKFLSRWLILVEILIFVLAKLAPRFAENCWELNFVYLEPNSITNDK